MKSFKPKLERLENRNLLAADLEVFDLPEYIDYNTDSIVDIATGPSNSAPILSSRPSATQKLFLDFDGRFTESWSFKNNITTPSYDFDGNTSSFSAAEINSITEIWQRVAEDYSIFNVDVTTVDPLNETDRVTAVVAIGGSYSDWYGSAAGGVAFVGGFANFAPNVAFVFSNSLGNSIKNVAEASSHEAGHLFGLSHQSSWSNGVKTADYNTGFGDFAPIMGNSYGASRGTWYNGLNSGGATQDDTVIIATQSVPFLPDDYTNSISNATLLANNFTINGIINDNASHTVDTDVFKLESNGGTVTLSLSPPNGINNTDLVLKILDNQGNVIQTIAPTNSYGATYSSILARGSYFVSVGTNGTYGEYGQYTLTGEIAGDALSFTVDGDSLNKDNLIDFGNLGLDADIFKTIVVTNNSAEEQDFVVMTTGAFDVFGEVFGILAPGESFTFDVVPDTSTYGTFAGNIVINGENYFNLSSKILLPAQAQLSSNQISFGSVDINSSVSQTLVITNVGEEDLNIAHVSYNGNFTVTNINPIILKSGETKSLVVSPNTTSMGNLSGSIDITTNVGNFSVPLSATVITKEITVTLNGTNIESGNNIDFGTNAVGSTVTKTLVVKNDGNIDLNITNISIPSVYRIVQGLPSVIPAGQSYQLIVGLNTNVAGTFTGNVVIFSNDTDESQFTLNVTGSVVGAEITISQNSQNINSGDTINFGSVAKNSVVTKTFIIKNDGLTTLTLNNIKVPTGFKMTQAPTTTRLGAGLSASFTIKLDTSKVKSYSGQIIIRNNDSNEGQFVINVNGAVTQQSMMLSLLPKITAKKKK